MSRWTRALIGWKLPLETRFAELKSENAEIRANPGGGLFTRERRVATRMLLKYNIRIRF